MDKDAVEPVQISGLLQPFLVQNPHNRWRPILDLSKPTFRRPSGPPSNKGSGLLPYSSTGTVQEISEISCPGWDIPVQSSAFRSVHSTHGVHCSSKGVETDGHIQGYKNPPAPGRLVGESQIPPGLSPEYSRSSDNMPRTRLSGEFIKIRTGTKQVFDFVGHQFDFRAVRTNTRNTVTTDLSGPAVHVSDRFTNRHRKASSPRPTSYETQTVASQKQLEGTTVIRKGVSNTKVLAPTLTMLAARGQCPYRPTITPNKTCSANLYRRINRRVGRSLKRTHCKRSLVPSRKQVAYQLPRTLGSLSSLKRVPRPLPTQDSTCSNRQHHSGVIHKQGRRHEVGPTLCFTMENLDLVHQKW